MFAEPLAMAVSAGFTVLALRKYATIYIDSLSHKGNTLFKLVKFFSRIYNVFSLSLIRDLLTVLKYLSFGECHIHGILD
jgi:hypothetical protein